MSGDQIIVDFLLSAYLFTGVLFLVSLLLASVIEVSVSEIRGWCAFTWIVGIAGIGLQTWAFPEYYEFEGLLLISMVAWRMDRCRPPAPKVESAPWHFRVFAILALALIILSTFFTEIPFGDGLASSIFPGFLVFQLYEDILLWCMLRTVRKDRRFLNNVFCILWIQGLAHLHGEVWSSFFSLVFILFIPMWALFGFSRVGFIAGVTYHFLYNHVYGHWDSPLVVEGILVLMLICWFLILATKKSSVITPAPNSSAQLESGVGDNSVHDV